MYLQSLHFTSLYLPAYLCGKLIKMTETFNFVSQKRTGKRFFQTYNYDSDKLNVYGQTKHIISSFLYNIRNYMYENSENLLKTVHFTENIY